MAQGSGIATTPRQAIRGPALTFKGDPFKEGLDDTLVYESDAIDRAGDDRHRHLRQREQLRDAAADGRQQSRMKKRIVTFGEEEGVIAWLRERAGWPAQGKAVHLYSGLLETGYRMGELKELPWL